MTLREVPVGLRHKGGQTSEANGWLLPATANNRAMFEARVNDLMGTLA